MKGQRLWHNRGIIQALLRRRSAQCCYVSSLYLSRIHAISQYASILRSCIFMCDVAFLVPTAAEGGGARSSCETSAAWLDNILNARALPWAAQDGHKQLLFPSFPIHWARAGPYTMAIVLGAVHQRVFGWQWVANRLVLGSKWDDARRR